MDALKDYDSDSSEHLVINNSPKESISSVRSFGPNRGNIPNKNCHSMKSQAPVLHSLLSGTTVGSQTFNKTKGPTGQNNPNKRSSGTSFSLLSSVDSNETTIQMRGLPRLISTTPLTRRPIQFRPTSNGQMRPIPPNTVINPALTLNRGFKNIAQVRQVATSNRPVNSNSPQNSYAQQRPRNTPIVKNFQKQKIDGEENNKISLIEPCSASTTHKGNNIISSSSRTAVNTVANGGNQLVIGKCVQHFTDEQRKVMIPLFLSDPNAPWTNRASAAAKDLKIDSFRIRTWFSNERKKFKDGNYPNWAKIDGAQYVVSYVGDKMQIELKSGSLSNNKGVNYTGNVETSSGNSHQSGPPKQKLSEKRKMKCEDGENSGGNANPNIQEKIRNLECKVQIYESVVMQCMLKNEPPSTERIPIAGVENQQTVITPQTQSQPQHGDSQDKLSARCNESFNQTLTREPNTINDSVGNGIQNKNESESNRPRQKDYSNESFLRRRENYSKKNYFKSEKKERFEVPRRREARFPVQRKMDYPYYRDSWRQNDLYRHKDSKYNWSSQGNYSNNNYSRQNIERQKLDTQNFKKESDGNIQHNYGKEVLHGDTGKGASANGSDIRFDSTKKPSYPTLIKFKPITQFQLKPNLPNPIMAATSGSQFSQKGEEIGNDKKINLLTRQMEICAMICSENTMKVYFQEIMHWIYILKVYFNGYTEKHNQVIGQTESLRLLMKKQTIYEKDQLEFIDDYLDKEISIQNQYINGKNFKSDIAKYWVPFFLYANNFKISVVEAVKDFIEFAKYMEISINKFPCLGTINKMFEQPARAQ